MSNDNDKILEDLEATNADEVVGGGPAVSVTVGSQQASMADNSQGGSTIKAGDAKIETREEWDGSTSVEAEHGERSVTANLDS